MRTVAVLIVALLATAFLASAKSTTLKKKVPAKTSLVQVASKAKWVESGFDQTTISEHNPDANSPEHHDAMVQGQEESEYDARETLDKAAKHARKLIDDAIDHAREYQGVVQLHFQMPKPAEPEGDAAAETNEAEGEGDAAALLEKSSKKHHHTKKHHAKSKTGEPTAATVAPDSEREGTYTAGDIGYDDGLAMNDDTFDHAVKINDRAAAHHAWVDKTTKALCEKGCEAVSVDPFDDPSIRNSPQIQAIVAKVKECAEEREGLKKKIEELEAKINGVAAAAGGDNDGAAGDDAAADAGGDGEDAAADAGGDGDSE